MNATWTAIFGYLAIGIFFFMMMRKGGYCGGHGHKDQKKARNPSDFDHK